MSLLQMSFFGAVLIIVITVIRAATIHKLPKKTFLLLWGIVLFRLLVPYTVPSAFSVYTLFSPQTPVSVNTIHAGNQYEKAPINGNHVAIEDMLSKQIFEMQQMPENCISPVAIGLMVWLLGMILCGIFFTLSYLHWRFEFQAALPIQNDFVEQWQETHSAKRPVLVRQSDKVSAPLSYGLWKSVILMPKKTDWNDIGQLEYILLHEYVHICHHDSAVKLISAFTLCVHWFNPLVWVMYFLLQRDIELACDESVVRRFGEQSKSIYANMLIDMEARKSGLMPLCNNFSKNAIEERIMAIMKMKKTSVMAVLLSAALIVGVAAAFATSASAKKAENTETAFSEEEYDKLLALQFDGYEDLSVSEYQKRVWELTDTTEYLELLERFSQDTAFYEMKDTDKAANFLFYTLEPLTAEKWQTREFAGYCKIGQDGVSDNASLEYSITLDIQDADALTVREYNNTCVGMINGLQNLLQNKTVEQLQNEAVMQKMLHAEIEALKGQWSSENLKVNVEYFYMPLSGIQDFWNKAALEDLLGMTKEDIVKELNKIAAEYGNDKITVEISDDQVSFECMDELNVEGKQYETGVISFGTINFKDEPSNYAPDNLLVNIDALRVREEASENAAVIGILQENREVTILSEKNGFYHILIPAAEGSLEGWVRKEYIDVD
ncbi:MAG: SH3 domain-containing protein [Lachnospiraceae bacterium]|nr:SH3 domain-containing protein [Lachnospiraceae bacterium]